MKRAKKTAAKAVKTGKELNAKTAKSAKGKKGKEAKARPANPAAHPLSGKVWTLEVAREACVPSPTNPRQDFKEEGLVELGRNLRTVGQLQALVARPRGECLTQRLKSLRKRIEHGLTREEKAELDVVEVLAGQQVLAEAAPKFEEVAAALSAPWMEFEIVAGERRWRAAGKKYGDLKTVRVDVRLLSTEEVVEVQWVENLQREDLSPLEEAEGLARLREQGWTVEKLCERFGKSKTVVFEKLKLARAEGAVRELVASGAISPSVAALIASVPDKQMQERLVKTPKDSYDGCAAFDHCGAARTVMEVKEWIARECLKQIPWKLDLVFDHPEMVSPACRDCPKMTRNMGEENPDVVKGPPRCMGLTCFAERAKAATEMWRGEALAKGLEFWPYEEFREKAHRRDHCVEGDLNWDGSGEGKKWEKLAKDVPHTILGEDRDGTLKRIWKRADLVAAGLVPERKEENSFGQQERARYKQMQIERAVQNQAIEAVLKRIHEDGHFDSIVLFRSIAHGLLVSLWHDSAKEMAKRRGVTKEALTEKSYVANLGMAECVGVLVEGLLLRGMRFNSDGLAGDAAAWAQVDLEAIRKEVKAGLKEKAKGKKGLNAKTAKTAKVEEGELVEA